MSALLSVKEVLERLGISESTLWRIMRRGEIRGFKVGDRHWRFEESDIDAYIQHQREKYAPDAQIDDKVTV